MPADGAAASLKRRAIERVGYVDEIVALPALAPSHWGTWAATIGAFLMATSMFALRRIGEGLPMNAFPPRRFVHVGPYSFVAHPIYIGFVITCAGVAQATGSAAGFWIVTPAAALACAAIVLGYERADLDQRFGMERARPLASLPSNDEAAPTTRDAVGVWLALFLPWCVGYEFIGHLPVAGAIDAMGTVESRWPVWMSTVPMYTSAYLAILVVPWLARSRRALRQWSLDACVGVAIGFLTFLVVPLIATPREFDHASLFAPLLDLERSDGVGGRAAFPSFHVFWSAMAAALIGQRGMRWAIPGWI